MGSLFLDKKYAEKFVSLILAAKYWKVFNWIKFGKNLDWLTVFLFHLGIYLECQGYSKFCFNELNSETFYSSEETYLDLKIPLIHNEGWCILAV